MCRNCCNNKKSSEGFFVFGIDFMMYAIADKEKLTEFGIDTTKITEITAIFKTNGEIDAVEIISPDPAFKSSGEFCKIDQKTFPKLYDMFYQIPLKQRAPMLGSKEFSDDPMEIAKNILEG